MVVDPSEIRYLKDKLFNILNSKMDIKELTDNMNSSNVDTEVKNLLILMYSSMVNHRSEVDRDRMLVLTQILEHINSISKEMDKIEDRIKQNEGAGINSNYYVDNASNEFSNNNYANNVNNVPDVNTVYTPPVTPEQHISNIPDTSAAVNTASAPVANTDHTKWYLNFKNIFLGGITFLPIIAGLTAIYSYNPEAAEKAVEIFFNIIVKIILPGV